jgi:hypothetical protein
MSKPLLNGRGWLAGTRVVVLLVIGILWALPATARDRPVILIGTVDAPKDLVVCLYPAGNAVASTSGTIPPFHYLCEGVLPWYHTSFSTS